MRRQDMGLGGVGHVADAALGTHDWKRTFLLSPIEKIQPKRFELRLERWVGKVVNLARDDPIPWQPQQPARGGVGVQADAVAIDDQSGLGRMTEDRPEQRLQFFKPFSTSHRACCCTRAEPMTPSLLIPKIQGEPGREGDPTLPGGKSPEWRSDLNISAARMCAFQF